MRLLGIAAASILVMASLAGCRRPAPKFESFEVQLELPPKPGQPAASPPEGALRPWRVWVNQERPRQKKAPQWQPIAAKEGAQIDMASDGKWRCLLNPVKVFGKVNERAKLADWVVSRAVRCSSDGFRTYVEGRVQASFEPDGKETETSPSAALYLGDVVDGQPRETTVVLEGEKVIRKPSFD